MAPIGRIDELRKRYDENPRRFFAPLANEYRKAGDLEQAIALCRLHLAEVPSNLSGQIVFGQALYEAGTFDDARTAFETAIGLDPENLIALRHLGDIARLQSDPARAKVWYQRVLDADRRNEEVLAIMAELAATEAAQAPPPMPAATPEPVADARPSQPLIEMRETTPAMHAAPETIELEEHFPDSSPALRPTPLVSPAIRGSTTPTVEVATIPTIVLEPTPIVVPAIPESGSFTVEPPAPPEPLDAIEDVPAEPALHADHIEVAEEAAPDLIELHSDEVMPADAVADPVPETEYGMVAPAATEPAAEEQFTPDSSFGFDIDLGAAATIPVASAPVESHDFGDIELVGDSPVPAEEPPHAEVESAAPDAAPMELEMESPELLTPVPEPLPEPAPEPASELPAMLDMEFDVAEPLMPQVEPALALESAPAAEMLDAPVAEMESASAAEFDVALSDVTPTAEFEPPAAQEPALVVADMLPVEFDAPPTPPRGSTPIVLDAFELDDAAEAAPSVVEPEPVIEAEPDSVPTFEPEHVPDLDTYIGAPAITEAPVEQRFELDQEPQAAAPSMFQTFDAIRDMQTPVAAAPPVEPFATETMAELYVRQGLRHEAIGVYRQLITARPDDAALRSRLSELEDEGRPAPVSTARSFFAGLSARRATPRTMEAIPAATPSASSGTVDKLFGRASVAMHDEASARALGDAYGDQPPSASPPPGGGGLDRLFGTASGGAEPSSSESSEP